MATSSVATGAQAPNLPDLHKHRVGSWLVQDRRVLHNWTSDLVKDLDRFVIRPEEWDDTIVALKDFIEQDSYIFELCSNMFSEIPVTYQKTPDLKPQVRDYMHMLGLTNHIIRRGPTWTEIADKVGLIGFPLNVVLDWPMGTISGYHFFKNQEVNRKFKAILDRWSVFLQSERSTEVLRASRRGWLAAEGMNALEAEANGSTATAHTFS